MLLRLDKSTRKEGRPTSEVRSRTTPCRLPEDRWRAWLNVSVIRFTMNKCAPSAIREFVFTSQRVVTPITFPETARHSMESGFTPLILQRRSTLAGGARVDAISVSTAGV